MQPKFHEGGEVNWMDAEDHYAVGKMRCVVLPSLEEGLVVGTCLRFVEPFSYNPARCLRIVSVSIIAVHIPETCGCARHLQ